MTGGKTLGVSNIKLAYLGRYPPLEESQSGRKVGIAVGPGTIDLLVLCERRKAGGLELLLIHFQGRSIHVFC